MYRIEVAKSSIRATAYAVIPGPLVSVFTEKSLKKSGSLSSSSFTCDNVRKSRIEGLQYTHDVKTSNKFTSSVELWESWPVGELFQALPDLIIRQYVEEPIFYTIFPKHTNQLTREATLSCTWSSLHEQHDWCRLDQI